MGEVFGSPSAVRGSDQAVGGSEALGGSQRPRSCELVRRAYVAFTPRHSVIRVLWSSAPAVSVGTSRTRVGAEEGSQVAIERLGLEGSSGSLPPRGSRVGKAPHSPHSHTTTTISTPLNKQPPKQRPKTRSPEPKVGGESVRPSSKKGESKTVRVSTGVKEKLVSTELHQELGQHLVVRPYP